MYFTEGFSDPLEKQLDPMGPIASQERKGGGGVSNSISKETYTTCDFPGCPDPLQVRIQRGER